MSKKILLVTYGGAHYKIISVIYKELIKKFSTAEVVLLALTSAQSQCLKDGLEFKTLTDYKDLFDQKSLSKIGQRLISRETFTLDYEESVLYHGLSFSDLSKSFGRETADRLFEKYGRAAFMPVSSMVEIITSEGADVVIATDSPRFEQAALSAAKILDVKALCIPTLFGNREIADQLFAETNSDLYRPKYDVACVGHEKAKENILRLQNWTSNSSVIVTGSPIFDEVIERFNRNDFARLAQRYCQYKTVYFYATQNYGNSLGILSEALIPAVMGQADTVLLVKPHPGENPADYQFLESYADIHLMEGVDANELAFVSDVILIEDSTVGLEALLMNKQVVSISLNADKANNFRDFDLCCVVGSNEELATFLKDYSAGQSPLTRGNTFYQMSSSVSKIVDLVCQNYEY